MDDNVDMAGSGEAEGTRTSSTHSDQSREQQHNAAHHGPAPLDSLQKSASVEPPTHAHPNNTKSTPASILVHNSSVHEETSRDIPSITLPNRDKTIRCSCPPGTVRFEIDLEVRHVNGQSVYLHKPCMRPNLLNQSPLLGDTGKSGGAAAALGRVNTERLAAKLLGPKATAGQRLKVKHFTSTFHCDGPCQGSKKIDDYFVCKQCCAWQHRSCMLYGEEGDVGDPVCNHCFMIHLAQRGSTVGWQRKRLVQAVREAWVFFKDPANRHQVSRRAYARRFLAAFILKNQASFVKFVAARKKADQLATGLPRSANRGDTKMDVDQIPQSSPLRRSMPKTQNSPSAASGDGLDDLEELDRRMSWDTDDSDLSLKDNSSSSTASTPRKYDRAYVERHKHKRNFHHRGKRTFFEGLPALDANIKAAVYGPGAAQWRIDAKAHQQSGKLSVRKAQPSKAEVHATHSAKTPRSKPIPSSQMTGPGKRKRLASLEESMEMPADTKIYHSSAARKTAPWTGPRKAFSRTPEESMEMPADTKIYQSSTARKTAPWTGPRKAFSPTPFQKHFTSNEREYDEDDIPTDKETPTDTPSPHDQVACSCKRPEKPPTSACFKCIECGTFQHKDCHDDTSNPTHCNFCFNSTAATKRSIEAEVALITSSKSSPEAIAAATKAAKAARAVKINGEDEYADAFRDSVSEESLVLCKTTLWKTWCNAPSPGQSFMSEPTYPTEPPEAWLTEARSRLEKLLHAAGREKSLYYLQPALKRWPRDDVDVMRSLRDLVLEVLHRGAYRRRRGELGVLAEVVGIEEKGTVWRGDVEVKKG